MREILFRGQALENNEWVYGSFIEKDTLNDFPGIQENHSGVSPSMNQLLTSFHIRLDTPIAVYRKTIGQYIGIQDCNGIKIFEGDIVRVSNFKIVKTKTQEVAVEPFNLEVLFFNGGFVFSTKEDIAREFALNVNEYFISKTDKDCYKVEVIGNIHENSELIEKGTPLANRFFGICSSKPDELGINFDNFPPKD